MNSICNLEIKVARLMHRRCFNQSLKLIHHAVERIITEPLCTALVSGSKKLDHLCFQIGQENLKTIKSNVADDRPHLSPCYVYIVTKLQKSGGHTQMIKNIISLSPNKKHIILLTGICGQSAPDIQFSQSSSVIIETTRGPYQQRLTWLQKRLLYLSPEKTFLFNHHQDSIAVAAIQPEMNLDAYFCHHGDHHLCLGVHLKHVKHVDFHPMGYYHCQQQLQIDNFYLPLSMEDKKARPMNKPFLSSGRLITCTVGRFNKIEAPYCIQYVEIIPVLLSKTKGRHVHIGKLTAWALYKLRSLLKKHHVDSQQFVYIPYVRSVWQALIQYEIDLYIASFPFGGGLTLVEVMGAGIPTAIHSHIYSRVLGGADLAPHAFVWRDPNDLFDYCTQIQPEQLIKQSSLGRQHFETSYCLTQLQTCLEHLPQQSIKPAVCCHPFVKEEDEWAFLLSKRIGLKHILLRAGHRWIRKLKTYL